MTSPAERQHVAESREHWRAVRGYLNTHRHELAQKAVALYRDRSDVHGLIIPEGWSPPAPVPLERMDLAWSDVPSPAELDGTEPATASVRPLRSPGLRYQRYSDAVAELDRPTLFEDRPSYRLLDLTVDGDGVGSARLTFGRGTFFNIIDVCEAVAHEFAQAAMHGPAGSSDLLPFRSSIADPSDLGRRAVVPAISVLTIRKSAEDGASFLLHRRDAAKVAHAGGMYQVMPVGVFQPSAPGPWNLHNDFDLFRSIAREYSEELLGEPELAGHDQPIAYDDWPFFNSLHHARASGDLRTYWLAAGIDPLSLVVDLLVVAVFEAEVFDKLFGALVATNAEGTVVTSLTNTPQASGIPFTHETVQEFADRRPMQHAGAALLHLAWQHRDTILA